MKGIFILPKDLNLNAYALIDNQVLRGLPINLGLIFNKYVNKFATGYLKNDNWIEGKQSDIKRQVYLLKEERAKSFKNLRDLRDIKGKIRVTIRDGRGTIQKYLYEIIDEILEVCDIEETFKIIKNIQNDGIKKELNKNLEIFLRTNLCLLTNLVDKKFYQSFYNRMKIVQANLRMQGYFVEEAILGLNWRLVINLGAASVYETSLLFHRNYSIPYIPGSAVKGVTNHYAIMLREEGKITNEEYVQIFGSQDKKGEAIFFDALPLMGGEKDVIVLDVMNVHYPDYYRDESGRTPPGDWMNPNPIFFLAVEKGTRFRFALASKDKDLAEKTKELLKEALEKIGIGAKTSAGYGYFEV
ncbi:MAG: type III-B CRISPR module RAMP protein Cmr6 [Candidatus Hydrothermarchaeota archaeon]|nr:MAG: type III-B CRISPR module RAMP protein Cmr6 [Candidatus Hydrothermarchaeota archaeon]